MQVSVAGLLLLFALGEPAVEAVSLDGESHVGLLQELTPTGVRMLVDGRDTALAPGELQSLRFIDADAAEAYDRETRAEVDLVDGTKIYCTGLVADARTMTLQSPVAGEIVLPRARVRSVRLGQWESAIDDDWRDLRERPSEQDLLIVRKGDDLDFAGGVVGAVDEDSVTMLLGERELEVPRERVFGFVFPHAPPGRDSVVCSLVTEAEDQLRLESIELRDDAFSGALVGGTAVVVPVDRVQSIDFGLGRIRYLTEMEPVATYETVGAISREYVLKYRRVEFDNDPLYPHLVIGRRTFKRGLWIHSGSVLRYRLNRDYKRLQAVMGMNRSSSSCAQFDPSVRVQFLADGEVVLDQVLTWEDEPRELDMDVDGVRDLEIRVSTVQAEPLGICEHLALAEARVIR